MSSGLGELIQNLNNPFTDEQLNELRQAKLEIPLAREALKKAQSAGIDVSQQLTDLDDREKRITSILSVYGGS